MPIFILLIAFVSVPLIEIALFIKVGGLIGLWPTLAIVLATAITGTWLLRVQGRAVLMRAQDSLNRQQFPAREVFDGLCLLFAGALLLTPGFFTDALGLLLFFPPFRRLIGKLVWRYLTLTGRIHMSMHGRMDGDVIDAEFEEVWTKEPDDDSEPPPRIGKGKNRK